MRLSDCVRHILCALCFLLAITAGSAFAAGNRGSITGSVVDPLGEAIAGASVSLLHNGDEVSQAATDERGAFLFPDVSSGRYQLHVVAQGFETRTTDAMFVAAGARAAVDVMLVSLRESVTHRAASRRQLRRESGHDRGCQRHDRHGPGDSRLRRHLPAVV